MGNFGGELVTIITAVIGLAIIATLVSNNANTSKVIGASTSGLGYLISTAVSPVTGNTPTAPETY